MAIFVAQESPDVIRRTPSSGDGGVDLLIPEEVGYQVQQVKGFTGRLERSQRRQISKSWDTFTTNPRLNGPVSSYKLVMPIDPTSDEQDWLDDLFSDSIIPVTCLFLPYWDRLATDYPHVIDYMINGGRERVIRRANAMMQMLHDPGIPISAEIATSSISTLVQQLNSEDPHYRYDFATGTARPTIEQIGPCVFSRSVQLPDGSFLATIVRARHRYSMIDSPISGSFSITLNEDAAEQFANEFEGFWQFGRALDIPPGSMSMSIVGLEGLGAEFPITGASGYISARRQSEAEGIESRLSIIGNSGDVLAEICIVTASVTSGIDGGHELIAYHYSGALKWTTRRDSPESTQLNGEVDFLGSRVIGQPIGDVIDVVRFIQEVRPGRSIEWRPKYGTERIALIDINTSIEAPADFVVAHLEDLAYCQEFAPSALIVPDEIGGADDAQLHLDVELLRGNIETGTWDSVTVRLKDDANRNDFMRSFSDEPYPIVSHETRTYDFDGVLVELGPFVTTLTSAQLTTIQPSDGSKVAFEPASDRTFQRRAESSNP